MSKSLNNPSERPGSKLAQWHRLVGVGAALVLLWLAATGIFLNHSEDLELDNRYLQVPWLLDLYGVSEPTIDTGFPVGNQWVVQVGEQLYLDTHPLGEHHAQSAVAINGEMIIATTDALLVITDDGRLIESLDKAHGVPSQINALGNRDGKLMAQTANGAWIADQTLQHWTSGDDANVQWSKSAAPPAALTSVLSTDYRARVLSWERVLLDIHSGRLFGKAGVVVMDIAGVALMILAGSGIVLWSLRRQSSRKKSKPERS